MEPQSKHPAIDRQLTNITGKHRPDVIRENKCVFCDRAATEFRDNLSKSEYIISGMCQVCQDETFGK